MYTASLSAFGLSGLFTQRGKDVRAGRRHRVAPTAFAAAGGGGCLQSGEPRSFKETQTPYPRFWPQSVIVKTASRLQLSGGAALGDELVSLSQREKLKEGRWTAALCSRVTS